MRDSIDTAQKFFDVVVKPNVSDAIDNQDNPRLVLNALISLHQMNDWAFFEYSYDSGSETGPRKQLKNYAEKLYERQPALGITWVYATNAKHCKPDSVDPTAFGTSAMDAGSPALTSIAKSADGTSERMLEIVRISFEFWEKELERLRKNGFA